MSILQRHIGAYDVEKEEGLYVSRVNPRINGRPYSICVNTLPTDRRGASPTVHLKLSRDEAIAVAHALLELAESPEAD